MGSFVQVTTEEFAWLLANHRPIANSGKQNSGDLLKIPKREGYHRHWVVDQYGNLQQAARLGMTEVRATDGQLIRRYVGYGHDHQQLYAQLFEVHEVRWPGVQFQLNRDAS